ncbi:MAG TPA: ABC transporter substrate-binding protein [Acidimicrobiales bacterium]|nr:ABC transporter substrate-binding protein [Acidimicrobiales bacterium]
MGRTTNGSRGWLVAVAVAAGMSLVAAACGSSGHTTGSAAAPSTTAAAKPVAGGSLVVGIPTESPGWNPAINEWDDTGNLVGSTVLEPLATPGADAGAKPWLATSWIANTNFTRWVVNLRKGVQFQDGTPFDAQAVVQNFDYYFKSPFYLLTLGPLFAGVKALSDSSVEVDFKQPFAAFPSSYLDSASTYMMAPAMINAPDHGSGHPIGTGPFVFSSWEQNNSFKVNRNPHYWGGLDASGKVQQGTPYLDSIEFRVITDDSTRSEALQSGDIDMLTTISPQTAESLASQFTEVKDWDAGSVFVQLNTLSQVDGKTNPFANIHARRALAYATDAAQIAGAAGKGLVLATSPFGPNTPWGMPSDQNGYVAFDLDKAKAEVAQYEQQTGASSLSFTLMGLPNLDVQKSLQQLAAQWQKAGITAHIQTLGQTARITAVVSGDFEATYTNNYGYPDPDNQYYFWTSSGIVAGGSVRINFSSYTTPQIDKDMNTGRESGYPNVRRAAYDDVVKQLNAGFTHIWLYYTPFTYAAQKKVQGLASPQGPAHVPFGNFMPKTWWGQIWLSR